MRRGIYSLEWGNDAFVPGDDDRRGLAYDLDAGGWVSILHVDPTAFVREAEEADDPGYPDDAEVDESAHDRDYELPYDPRDIYDLMEEKDDDDE